MSHHPLAEPRLRKLFSPAMALLCVVGLGLNLILSRLVIYLGLPLYIDNVGSILTAALGGALSGMAVGFFSNVLGSLSTPISMYYGILTVLIAWLAALFSRAGALKRLRGALLAAGCFVLIGGAAGSVMTWFFYGGGIGGLAGPLALRLNGCGLPEFWAQLAADVIIDIPDKLITVGIVFLLLRFFPQRLVDRFPLSHLYDRRVPQADDNGRYPALKHSVNTRIVSVLVIAMTLVSAMAVLIGTVYHHQRLVSSYENVALIYARQAADLVDADSVELYLETKGNAPGYTETKAQLTRLYGHAEKIAYLYVYVVREDGCHVVFDVDAPGLAGSPAGSVVENETYFYNNADLFLSGSDVPPEFTTGEYGALITAYSAIRDVSGRTVAYAGADIDLGNYVMDLLTYIIQLVSLLFALVLLVSAFALWFVNRHITTPLRAIVAQSQSLDQISPEKWLTSEAWCRRTQIHTGDEIEELYRTVCGLEENASLNVRKLIETEQKLVQTRELERINRQLEQTIRRADEANRAKTDFLSRMSHDIRTPLNAILGTAALARDDLNNPAAQEESLDTIAAAGQFLLGLINDILDINKIENGNFEMHPEPYRVEEFISSVENTIRPLAEKKNIRFHFDMGCGHGLILVDKLRYKQIFFNLLSNAIKYTPEGGDVEFVAEPIDAPPQVAGVRNFVRDNGIGMSPEYMQHLYEPFTRDKNASINRIEGSGLGLAIVKSIVDAMGGTIRVNSALGKGTEFIVDLYLPVPDAQTLPDAPQAVADESALQGLRILLVEDNAVNTRIAARLLERKGCRVVCAENGQRAVELFRDSAPGEFEIVLMDIRMPVMDGLEATRVLRALDRADARSVPVIAMTANAYAADVALSLEAGMNAHLAKPIEPEKLYAALLKFSKRTPQS